MKFLGTTVKEVDASRPEPQTVSCDGCEDPAILTSQLGNTKASWRGKKFNQVRISEIDSFCPREYAIGFLTETQAENFVDFALQQVFDLGSALHYWIQNKSKVYKNSLCGYWTCRSCRNLRVNQDGSTYFGTRPALKCEHCGAFPDVSEYEEYMFRLTSPYRIVGKIDAVLYKEGVYRFADFKSFMKKEDFPKGAHVAQVAAYSHFYQFVPEEEKLPVPIDTSTSYIIYLSKAFSYRESILTYPIRPTSQLINLITNRVKEFTDATQTGTIPPPFEYCIRNNWEKGKAKKCHLSQKCKEYYEEGKCQLK